MTHGKPSAHEKFTPKQWQFIESYLREPSQASAARAAGYKHPDKKGWQVFQLPHIRAEIERRQGLRAKAVGIDEAWVLRELKGLYDKFCQNVRPALNSKTGKALLDPDSGEPLYRFDGTAALKALELLGKHVRVNAFQENVKHSVDQDMVERIHAGRKRARLALHASQIEDVPARPALPRPDPEVLAEFAATRKSKLKPQPE